VSQREVAGGAGGALKVGRFLNYPSRQSNNNLLLSVYQAGVSSSLQEQRDRCSADGYLYTAARVGATAVAAPAVSVVLLVMNESQPGAKYLGPTLMAPADLSATACMA